MELYEELREGFQVKKKDGPMNMTPVRSGVKEEFIYLKIVPGRNR